MEQNETISVEIVYIKPDSQIIIKLELSHGSNIEKAISMSGLLKDNPEIDLQVNKVGIFNKIQGLDTILKTGDRVEIYRSLQADPKEARRRRAKK